MIKKTKELIGANKILPVTFIKFGFKSIFIPPQIPQP